MKSPLPALPKVVAPPPPPPVAAAPQMDLGSLKALLAQAETAKAASEPVVEEETAAAPGLGGLGGLAGLLGSLAPPAEEEPAVDAS